MDKNSYLGRYFEGLFLVLIFLVSIQTFCEEYFIFMNYSVLIRKYMIIAGCAFDLIFTIEFFSRLFISGKKGGTLAYMSREGGFIDLLSSIPLLLFHSGPLIWVTFFAGEAGILAFLGTFSFLKIIKVFRIARTLRFLRPLKLLGKIKRKYRMSPIFLSRAIAISITVIILALIGFSFLDKGTVVQSKSAESQILLENYIKSSSTHNFKELLTGAESVLFIKKGNETVYKNLSDRDFQDNYFNDDFYMKKIDSYEIYFNNKDAKKIHSFINMIIFSIMIGIIIGFSTFYRRFFNRHISRVASVILRGFKTADYSTAVRIDNNKKDFEIYQIADQYNRKWLPIKRRIIEIKKEHSS